MKDLSWGVKLVFISLAILLIVASGWIIAQYGVTALIIIPMLILGIYVVFQTIRNPFWGFLVIQF